MFVSGISGYLRRLQIPGVLRRQLSQVTSAELLKTHQHVKLRKRKLHVYSGQEVLKYSLVFYDLNSAELFQYAVVFL